MKVYFGDNLDIMKTLPSESVQLIYTDPPYNTGIDQVKNTTKIVGRKADKGNGWKYSYELENVGSMSYNDYFEDYEGFIMPRVREMWRILKPTGMMYIHLDYREVHYLKVWMDKEFGRDKFLNEIIWAWDYGQKSKSRWPCKHNNILVYVKQPDDFYFDITKSDRIPYLAPGMVTEEKAALGKLPTDCWWHSIVGTSSREKTGYPSQKPLDIPKRIILTSSREGDMVMDPFGGSGTTAEAAQLLRRDFIIMDQNPAALETMKGRLKSTLLNKVEYEEFKS
jgi:site-specific DNA-methyltransferase (adenine-specific)